MARGRPRPRPRRRGQGADGGPPAEFTRRLRQEAQAAAALTHPNITGVYDYGEHDAGPVGWQGHIPYVVMELLDGETLATRLSRGPLPWREAAGTCARVADALAAAHAAGIVHRDIKPANVFLTPVGVKVLDFGIAFTGSPDGQIMGTPAYVAPELLTGTAPTPGGRHLLAGRRPARVPDRCPAHPRVHLPEGHPGRGRRPLPRVPVAGRRRPSHRRGGRPAAGRQCRGPARAPAARRRGRVRGAGGGAPVRGPVRGPDPRPGRPRSTGRAAGRGGRAR
ncbi:protein kinase domain-containing protein [Actinomadura madurae]|uniref:protein kinase domain-containing protein n=1 Tax=Actinomadura madurae TaxID=1993 RepID=UPI0027E24EA4|nr:protein kinase [Actinomadura madurae]